MASEPAPKALTAPTDQAKSTAQQKGPQSATVLLVTVKPTPGKVSQERCPVSAASRELMPKTAPRETTSDPYPLSTPSTVGPTLAQTSQEYQQASEDTSQPWKTKPTKLASNPAPLNPPSIPASTERSTSTEYDRGPSCEENDAEGDNHSKKQDIIETETQTADSSNGSTPSKPNDVVQVKIREHDTAAQTDNEIGSQTQLQIDSQSHTKSNSGTDGSASSSWYKTKVARVCGAIIAVLTLIATVIALWSAFSGDTVTRFANVLAEWTSKKDFIKFRSTLDKPVKSLDCKLTENLSLLAPPYFSDHWSRHLRELYATSFENVAGIGLSSLSSLLDLVERIRERSIYIDLPNLSTLPDWIKYFPARVATSFKALMRVGTQDLSMFSGWFSRKSFHLLRILLDRMPELASVFVLAGRFFRKCFSIQNLFQGFCCAVVFPWLLRSRALHRCFDGIAKRFSYYFTLNFINQLHLHTFQRVYEWIVHNFYPILRVDRSRSVDRVGSDEADFLVVESSASTSSDAMV